MAADKLAMALSQICGLTRLASEPFGGSAMTLLSCLFGAALLVNDHALRARDLV